MAEQGIVFTDVSLAFGGHVLFQKLSFSLAPGSCTCLLGPSGCGKSTILKLIAGNPELDFSGTILCAGHGKKAGKTAWMAQQDLLLPWLNVQDNVLLGAKLRGRFNIEKCSKAQQLLEQAGLGRVMQSLPATLSGGMRQRVALLRTLMEEREIILMDEPFSALDALTRFTLQDLSAQLTRGATVLLVTHDPMEALRMANRILVLGGDPVEIQNDIILQGSPPRSVDDAEVVKRYPQLLALLMLEQGPPC